MDVLGGRGVTDGSADAHRIGVGDAHVRSPTGVGAGTTGLLSHADDDDDDDD